MDHQALSDAKAGFRERKAASMNAERAESQEVEAPKGEDLMDDQAADREDEQVVADGESNADAELLDDTEDLDEAADGDEAVDGDDERSYEQMEQDYKELEKKLSEVTENRRQNEENMAAAMESFTVNTQNLQELTKQAVNGAKFYADLANQHLKQMQSINPATLAPEQQHEYYQNLNQATQQAQQYSQMYQQAQQGAAQAIEQQRQAQAEVTLKVLKVRIPEWNNDYYNGPIATEAKAIGYSDAEFAELLDPRVFIMLHERVTAKNAAETIETKRKQRKAKAPRKRVGRATPRNDKGQFAKAKQQAQSTPGDRSANRNYFREKLRQERAGR
jgi:hypothetical protein